MKPQKKVFFCVNTGKKGVNYKKACKIDECERSGHSKHNKTIGGTLHYR